MVPRKLYRHNRLADGSPAAFLGPTTDGSVQAMRSMGHNGQATVKGTRQKPVGYEGGGLPNCPWERPSRALAPECGRPRGHMGVPRKSRRFLGSPIAASCVRPFRSPLAIRSSRGRVETGSSQAALSLGGRFGDARDVRDSAHASPAIAGLSLSLHHAPPSHEHTRQFQPYDPHLRHHAP
jgi:hypothetical protein